jgi:hypothetical protein
MPTHWGGPDNGMHAVAQSIIALRDTIGVGQTEMTRQMARTHHADINKVSDRYTVAGISREDNLLKMA